MVDFMENPIKRDDICGGSPQFFFGNLHVVPVKPPLSLGLPWYLWKLGRNLNSVVHT